MTCLDQAPGAAATGAEASMSAGELTSGQPKTPTRRTATSSEIVRGWPINVKLLYNNGRYRDLAKAVTVCVSNVDQILAHANKHLPLLAAAAARVFSLSGGEIFAVMASQDGMAGQHAVQ